MTASIPAKVTGAEQLVRVARAMKDAGDREIRKDLLRGIRDGVRPVGEAMKEEYRDGLPHGGGLNEAMAAAKISPRTRTSGKSAGVRLVYTSPGHDMPAVERGQIRHPVYGHGPWVSQTVPSGLGEKGVEKSMPKALDAVQEAMQDTLRRIARMV